MSRKQVDPADFVRFWNTAESIDDVCKHFGLSRQACYFRYYRYRKNGVTLKSLEKARPRIDYAELDAIAKEALNGNGS